MEAPRAIRAKLDSMFQGLKSIFDVARFMFVKRVSSNMKWVGKWKARLIEKALRIGRRGFAGVRGIGAETNVTYQVLSGDNARPTL